MRCSVEGCERDAHYKAQVLCTKHYFRKWRYGTTALSRTARPSFQDDRGYRFIHSPKHPLLAKGQIYMAEHRAILYEAMGPGPMCCELCGVQMTWKTCQTDHIDENPSNNERSNLRPLCRRCNTWRSMPPAHIRKKNAIAITYDGMTMTPHEWARDPRVNICGHQIRRRKRAGMSDEQALFGEKITHNGNVPAKKPAIPKTFRKNAVNLTIDGVIKTLAEWARHEHCEVTPGGIKARVQSGWSHKDAVFKKSRFT